MCLADGVIADEEKDSIGRIYQIVTQRDFPRAEIEVEMQHSQKSQDQVLDTLFEMSPYLNSEGKEMVFKAAYFLAVADGEFHKEEEDYLFKIAAAMEITRSHFRGMIQDLIDLNRPEPVGVGD